jgi:hypothetical protein
LVVAEDLSLNGRLFVSGNVGIGIGTTNPQYALDVAGVIRSNNLPKYWNVYRLYGAPNFGSSTFYHLLGTLPDFNSGINGGSISIKGFVGGFTNSYKASIDITLTTRGASATTIGVVGTMTAGGSLASVIGVTDIVVYYQGGGGNGAGAQYYIYLVVLATYSWFDFNVSGNDQNIAVLAEPACGTTTTPAGTKLSGTPSILSALQTYTIGSNVGIGTTNPQSALDVTGAIRVSGGITPTYSTPSFSAGQVGFIYQGTFNNSTSYAAGSYNVLSTITFLSTDIGVWLINANAFPNSAQGAGFGYIQVTSNSGTFTIPNSTCSVSSTMNSASQQYLYNPISFVTKVQGASVLNFAHYPVNATTINQASYFIATRIA